MTFGVLRMCRFITYASNAPCHTALKWIAVSGNDIFVKVRNVSVTYKHFYLIMAIGVSSVSR